MLTITYYNGNWNVYMNGSNNVDDDTTIGVGNLKTDAFGDIEGGGTNAFNGNYYSAGFWDRYLNTSEMDWLYARGRNYTLYGDHTGAAPPAGASGNITVNLTSPADNSWATTENETFYFNWTASANITSCNCTLFLDGNPVGTNNTILNNTKSSITTNTSLTNGNKGWFVNCTNGTETGQSASFSIQTMFYNVTARTNYNGTTINNFTVVVEVGYIIIVVYWFRYVSYETSPHACCYYVLSASRGIC